MGHKIRIDASREQLAMLAEVLLAAFQDGELVSQDHDKFIIEIDDNPAIYCVSNQEALCYEVLKHDNCDEPCEEETVMPSTVSKDTVEQKPLIRTPQNEYISRVEAPKLYALEETRNDATNKIIELLQKRLGCTWSEAAAQTLFDMLENFGEYEATLAAQTFLKNK